jgi:hypothetical protein
MLSKSSCVERFDNPSRTPPLIDYVFFAFRFIEIDDEIYTTDWPEDPPPSGGFRFPDLSSYGITLNQGDSAAIPSFESTGELIGCDNSALKVAFVDGGVYHFHEDSPCMLSAGNCAGESFGTTDPWY